MKLLAIYWIGMIIIYLIGTIIECHVFHFKSYLSYVDASVFYGALEHGILISRTKGRIIFIIALFLVPVTFVCGLIDVLIKYRK